MMSATRIKKVLLVKLFMILAGFAFFSALSISSPFTPRAAAAPTWAGCGIEGGYCIFTGTRIVGYGTDFANNSKKIASRMYKLSDGSTVEGVGCFSAEFGAAFKLYSTCSMLIDPEAELDASWSTSTSEDNKSVSVSFSVKETQVGTIADLKSKIKIKRTDDSDFRELDPEDVVSNVTSTSQGALPLETSILQITFKNPLMGTGNQLLLQAGALANGQGAVLDRPIAIDVNENDLGSWQLVGNRGLSAGLSMGGLGMVVLDGTPYVAYIDDAYGHKLFVKKYDGSSWVSVDGGGLSAGFVTGFSMISSGGSAYVAYHDYSDSLLHIKKYDGSSWSSIDGGSSVQIQENGTGMFSLAVYNNTPYIAYSDKANGNRLTVKAYNGSSWDLLGVSGLSQDAVSHISMMISEGTPYVAYRNEFPIFVYGLGWTYQPSGWAKKFDQASNSWSDLGKFTNDQLEETTIIVKDGIPYVAYVDMVSGRTGTTIAVKKREASGWTIVDGNGSISNGSAYSFNVSKGTLYLTYIGSNGKTAVKKLIGSEWIGVGNSGMTENGATYSSLYVENEVPYLATSSSSFGNVANNYKPDVYKFLLDSPALTADLTNNNTVSPVVVTFPDSAAWRRAITAIKDGTTMLPAGSYAVVAGKIMFNAGVLSAGSHTLTITATNYMDATIRQDILTGLTELSNLSISGGTLQFNAATTNYTVGVASNVASVTVTPTAANTTASAAVAANGGTSELVASGQPSSAIPLNAGSNILTVVVTSQDGLTSKTYTIEVFRVSDDALLSDMTVEQGSLTFVPSKLEYSVNVPYGTTSLGFSVTKANSNQTLAVKGADEISVTGSVYAYSATHLAEGPNVIEINVTAQDGTTMNPYRLLVNRAPAVSGNADLRGITLSSGILTPAFAPGTTDYTTRLDYAVSSLALTANLDDNRAMVTVKGNPASSGQPSGAIGLVVGSNVIPIVVTAEDGTSKTYRVTVTRDAQTGPPGDGGTGGTGGGSTAPNSTPVTSDNGQLSIPKGHAGEVSLQNEVKVFIPADASAKDLNITIDKLLDTQNLFSHKEDLVSPIFEILKNFSENFNRPVTLTFAFDPSSLTGDQKPAVFYYDETKKVWVKVGGVVDGERIVVEVDHFTKYAVFAVGGTPEVPTIDTDLKISDISGHWAEANIKQAVSEGIVAGYPDGTFKPNYSITRAEFVVMLANALKLQGDGAELTFADSNKIGAWARRAVSLAVHEGIITGYDDGSFRPNAEITRAEMAVMIAKALGKSDDANAATGFADERDIASWARGSVAYVKGAGIVNGKGDNRFAPQDHATRAEAVAVLLRARD